LERVSLRSSRGLAVALALLIWIPAPALATSGGASVGPAPAKHRARRSSVSSAQAQSSPFSGRGMWIWELSQSDGGNPASIIATARSYGVSEVIIKAGDGASAWAQFNPTLVAALHAGGLRVCAWQYVYGAHPVSEAEVGAAAVHAGADCLLVDAESEYEGKYVQAQQYITTLRQLIGPSFPVGLAGFPYIDYHPAFPYSVFLGAGGAQYDMPQMYWSEIGASVDAVYAHTYEFNQLYQRPIEVLGEIAGDPPPAEVVRFRQRSRAYGATLVSWWDWQSASAAEWQAIAEPFSSLQGAVPAPGLPTLSVASGGGISAGDLVVWAQEHLLEAGETVQIDGEFGSGTQAAVEQFQAAHGIPVTGMVDPTTWQALLRYPRPTVVWTGQQGTATAAIAARALTATKRLTLPVPLSASLPAKGYEIPESLGKGR